MVLEMVRYKSCEMKQSIHSHLSAYGDLGYYTFFDIFIDKCMYVDSAAIHFF